MKKTVLDSQKGEKHHFGHNFFKIGHSGLFIGLFCLLLTHWRYKIAICELTWNYPIAQILSTNRFIYKVTKSLFRLCCCGCFGCGCCLCFCCGCFFVSFVVVFVAPVAVDIVLAVVVVIIVGPRKLTLKFGQNWASLIAWILSFRFQKLAIKFGQKWANNSYDIGVFLSFFCFCCCCCCFKIFLFDI